MSTQEEQPPQQKWQELRDHDELKTGDLLLFHHNDEFDGVINGMLSIFNDLIGWATHSKYTHSAIVIKDPDFCEPPLPKGLYVLESSYEPFPDAENYEYKIGVELERFEDVMEKWSGPIYWRKLHCTRDEKFYQTLANAHSVLHNRPYDIIPTDWVRALFKIDAEKDGRRTKTFWCSALCAYLYVQWGFLPKDTPWSIIAPKSLGTEEGDQLQLAFRNCVIDSEYQIKF